MNITDYSGTMFICQDSSNQELCGSQPGGHNCIEPLYKLSVENPKQCSNFGVSVLGKVQSVLAILMDPVSSCTDFTFFESPDCNNQSYPIGIMCTTGCAYQSLFDRGFAVRLPFKSAVIQTIRPGCSYVNEFSAAVQLDICEPASNGGSGSSLLSLDLVQNTLVTHSFASDTCDGPVNTTVVPIGECNNGIIYELQH